jgi:translocation and assembly module TamA
VYGADKQKVSVTRWYLTTLLAIVLALPAAAHASVRPICPGYRIDAKEIVKFNANEKKLICGDPDAVSWQNIPRFQAEYFLRTFLQTRGYFFPEFREEDGIVTVVAGTRTYVTKIDVVGAPPPTFHIWKKRQVQHTLLTPDVLNSLEGWTKSELKNHGFACPVATTTADAETGEVQLDIEPGDKQRIASVDEEPVEKLRPGTLRRFDAFHVGDVYDYRNLTLTSRRIVEDGILQSGYFLTECTPEGAKLTQKSIPGAKRLVSVGFGASTEEYFIVKATWKQARIGKNGSSFLISGRGSYRKQRLLIQGLVYPLPFPTRWHLAPTLLTRRELETPYEYISNDLALPPTVTWDTPSVGFELSFGPKFNLTRTLKGASHGWSHFTSAIVNLSAASHDYEYWLSDPRSGYAFSTTALLNSDKVLSSFTAQKLTIQGQALWNIAGFDPPLFILGIRGFAGTTIANDHAANFSTLPPWFLYYLGGSQNMRGFSRLQLPNGARGALTSLYAGAELRLANILPLNLQPIVFADVGALGQKSLNIDGPGYWSPGFGIRWPSFVGVMRFTVAHSYLIRNRNPINNGLSHWQFYFALGEEF